jgi:GntP family gluconate:H+ symporter
MSPFLILLIGMAVVIGGVLFLRVHAFLALTAAALIVSFLTPREAVYEQELVTRSVVSRVPDVGAGVIIESGASDGVVEGTVFLVMRRDESNASYRPAGRVQVQRVENDRSFASFVDGGDHSQIREGDVVILPGDERAAFRVSRQSIGQHVATGFGRTCLSIGILIAMAAIIGKCLLDSGGAERVVLAIRRALGEERTGPAFLGSGFVVAIPVFFDTVFYLLVPLAKAMRIQTGKHYVLYILCIVAGAAVAHSLVPPTPGPLFVASELGVDLGLMILGGSIVGLVALPFGYVFARWADRRWDIPVRPSAELTADQLKEMAHRDAKTLPSLWLSLMPILLPVILIAGNTILDMAAGNMAGAGLGWFKSVMDVIGNKNVALVLAGAIALVMLAGQKRGDRDAVTKAVQAALASGGVIILITAAGGGFGHVLRLTGISQELKDLIPVTQLILLPAAFATTSLVRIAQGSATVSMITSVGIFAPIAALGTMSFHPLYLALAIGCGSMPYSWMNDSGFWIVSTMSGFTEAETLKSASIVIALMGISGLVATMFGAWLFPLV